MYGVDCSKKCGACVNNEECHHVNGSCLMGCERGYHGQKCNQGNFSTLKKFLQFLKDLHNLYATRAERQIKEKWFFDINSIYS